ncbi:MAG: hypothetical protein HY321_04465 [Armatimonadetes bacterium]|nr:hypothetical protein [Armatimonadota bacterium]
MAEESNTAVLDAFRDEVRGQLEDIRREIQELRRLLESTPQPARRRPSREEALAGLEEITRRREAILRDRGGALLPPAAEGIARAREERTRQILREAAE